MVSELRNHQVNLERIIDDRTLELKRTNEELKETVKELNKSNFTLQQTRDNWDVKVKERTEDLTKRIAISGKSQIQSLQPFSLSMKKAYWFKQIRLP